MKNQIISGFVILLMAPQAWAKDLYVSVDNGNDAISHDANDIDHPWQTVAHAWASTRDGDIVYYREGTYIISSEIDVPSSGEGVTHMAYPGEVVTWSSPITGSAVVEIGEPNTTIDGINVLSAVAGGDGGFFRLGWNSNHTAPDGFTLRNATCVTSRYGGNTGIVHARGGASYGTVENCEIVGAGVFHTCGASGDRSCANNTGIIMFQGQGWVIRNNIIRNFNTGLFFNKHPNPKSDRDSQVINNWIYDCGSSIRTSSNYTLFANNILENGVNTGYDGGCAADGNCGSDFNRFVHNTIVGRVTLEDQTRSGDDEYPGARNNTFQDNIFVLSFFPIPWDSSPHDSILDYNLYPGDDAVMNNSQSYDLSEWQSYYGQDEHSLEGAPVFVAASPAAIEEYQLDQGSPGYQSASDGTDMGANISLVGPDSDPGGEEDAGADGGAGDGGPDADIADAGPDATDSGPDTTDASADAADASPDAEDAAPDTADTGPDATEAGPDAADSGGSDAADDASPGDQEADGCTCGAAGGPNHGVLRFGGWLLFGALLWVARRGARSRKSR